VDDQAFWEIIERTNGDADAVERALAVLSGEEIEEWHGLYYDLLNALHRWKLWGAAYVINGGCSDDGFHYFKAWVIGKGLRAYQTALEDPDSLGSYVTQDDIDQGCENEALNYAAEDAYRARYGMDKELDRKSNENQEPSGIRWKYDELPKLLPKLTARFWS
jgi:hypothetical protein